MGYLDPNIAGSARSMNVSALSPTTSRVDADAFEHALQHYVADSLRDVPPRLHAAIRHALFGAAGRLRPRLCLVVAQSYGGFDASLAVASALAVEFVHCASLVHDDLPCFDDAATRRGRPSVHAEHGESAAVLAGDALIVQAFQVLAEVSVATPRACHCLVLLGHATGPVRGIIAGQAWEAEPNVSLGDYHRAKTASLFEFAAMAGALSADADPEAWRPFGCAVGMAYQAADDLADAVASSELVGKPVGQDLAHHRPSAVLQHGAERALVEFERALRQAEQAIPPGCEPSYPRAWLRELHRRVREWFADPGDLSKNPPTSLPSRGDSTLQPRLG